MNISANMLAPSATACLVLAAANDVQASRHLTITFVHVVPFSCWAHVRQVLFTLSYRPLLLRSVFMFVLNVASPRVVISSFSSLWLYSHYVSILSSHHCHTLFLWLLPLCSKLLSPCSLMSHPCSQPKHCPHSIFMSIHIPCVPFTPRAPYRMIYCPQVVILPT